MELLLLLIMSQGPDFRKTFIPTVMMLKVSSFGFSIFNCGIKTQKSQNRIFTYKSVIFGLGGSSSPIDLLLYCKLNPHFYVSKITLYDIFIVFGLQIPSHYVQDILWTKSLVGYDFVLLLFADFSGLFCGYVTELIMTMYFHCFTVLATTYLE